jgi:hypothetical protein
VKNETTKAFGLAKADLARSGIAVKSPMDLERMGMHALSPAEALEFMPERWKRHAPEGLCCLKLDYHGIDGRPTGFWRLRRLEDAQTGPFGTNPELSRYHQQDDSRPHVWFSRSVDWPKALAAAAKGETRVLIVEGEKKGQAVCARGGPSVVAIALGGVWNTGSRRHRIEVIPDLLEVAELARGFKPVVCFDTDPKVKTRIHVGRAAVKLGDLLRSQGSDALRAALPGGPDGKMGADDYIVQAGWDAFVRVVDSAEPIAASAEMTDLGNATRLARRATGDFMFVPQWNRWLAWDGRRWAADDRGTILELAAEVTKEMLLEAGTLTAAQGAEAKDREPMVRAGACLAKHALSSQKSERIAAMVKLAPTAAPAALKADPDAFDADPWLLNVENGTVDLRTGELRPHDPGDLITKLAPVAYDPDAGAPRFERFVEEVLPSRGLRGFVQRFLGYVLTGDVREHKLGFFHGEGRNGKGVLMNTVSKLMGDYATVVPEALLARRSSRGTPPSS